MRAVTPSTRSSSVFIVLVTTARAAAGCDAPGSWRTSAFAVAAFGTGAMTIDPAGATHVIMVDGGGAVSHATNASGRWVTESAGSTRLAGDSLTVAADGAGALHVLFF